MANDTPVEVGSHDYEFEADGQAAYSEGREQEREFIRATQAAMTPECPGWAYLRGRGFTDEEIGRFGFGFDRHPRHGWKDQDGRWIDGPRIVIPWEGADWYHIDRAIDSEDNPAAAAKYTKPTEKSVGKQPVYNPDALNEDHVFVVEGLVDALALQAVGHPAIAIAGTAYSETVTAIAGRGYRGVVIAMLDADETGRRKNSDLVSALEAEHVAVYAPELTREHGWRCKDAGEMLQYDRRGLMEFADYQAAVAREKADELERERYDEALTGMRALDPVDVALGISALSDEDEAIPTGIRGLDSALGGGLRRGVTTLGAISSLGKTTLVLQIADHIAENGHPVLFVTVEQSAQELVAKSIVRTMRASYGATVPTSDVLSRSARDGWGRKTETAFDSALRDYSTGAARNMRIYEATKQPSVESIREVAAFMAKHDGRPPVVFIDYLQLLAAEDERDSDKTKVDRNMMALRQMARDLKTPVFVISSLNRSSYSEAISLDAFKESGSVEYSSDVLLGLQPANMAARLAGASDAKRKYTGLKVVAETKAQAVRDCEIVVLKNRNGAMPAEGIPVTFHAAAALFRDGRAPSTALGWEGSEMATEVI